MKISFIFSAVHHLAVIKSLINNYIDLKMASIEMAESVQEYGIVEVKDKTNNCTVIAKVDLLDHRMVTDKRYKWRLHTSGYAVASHGKTSTFMHSLVFGSMATHINGDRLDNRRSNLVLSKRSKVGQDEEIEIHGTRPLYEYDSKDESLRMAVGDAVVRYGNKKSYKGTLWYGIPEGIGVLTTETYDIIGVWKNGKIDRGIQINYQNGCMCEHFQICPLRDVIDVELIKSGFKIRQGHLGGDHQEGQEQTQDGHSS